MSDARSLTQNLQIIPNHKTSSFVISISSRFKCFHNLQTKQEYL